jgi:hypothetical protein
MVDRDIPFSFFLGLGSCCSLADTVKLLFNKYFTSQNEFDMMNKCIDNY